MFKLVLWYPLMINGMITVQPGPETNLTFKSFVECKDYMKDHWVDFGSPPAGVLGSYNSNCRKD